MVRTYEDHRPGYLCLQLRKRNRIVPGLRSKNRNMLAHAVLAPDQVLALRNALTQFLGAKRQFTSVGDTNRAGSTTNNIKFEIRTDNPQQAYDMARLMLLVGNLYGGACCVKGAVTHGPWPPLPGVQLSPQAAELAAALRSIFEA